MKDKNDFSHTLNLPHTDFPMKAELARREPQILKFWQDIDIYRLIREKSKNRPKYILHDGPPYANGDIHIGHALNKSLKDIVIKYKTLCGFDASFVPGWDCHGLPVEYQLFKELGINKSQIGQLEFRKKAYDYALKYVKIQREQFKRLGVFGDWDNPYLTLSPEYEAEILRAFGILVKKGYLYRGKKPVNWCFVCETALAEAEVEYEEKTSFSIYVKFKLEKNDIFKENSFLVIWTTTPWTLVANVAVAVNPNFSYLYIQTDKGNLIINKERTSILLEEINIRDYKIIDEFLGKDLEGLSYKHPFINRRGKVVLADYVSKDEGSGLVHIAPGHGNEDYLTGLKYNLEVIMPVDDKGNFDETVEDFSGINVYKAEELIIEKLKKLDVLIFKTKISHSYPHCWRCKNPLIFRATKQWFLSLEHQNLREKLLNLIRKDEVNWIPPSGKERILAMIELRPDWCLSRQRYWGVPIPSLVCNNCKEEFLDPELIEKLTYFVEKEGSDCWFKIELEKILPEKIKCPSCGGKNFSKGNDIIDVWFDSGVSNQAVLKKRKELDFPADLYLEGSDQHRGWFQSSLIPSFCIDDKAPFKTVLTHGFVVDGKGMKMSKSLGNVVSPFDVIKDFGADILRLWVASSDYREDIRLSKEILTRLSEAYRKIRNTIRFILSNLFDFDPNKDRVEYLYLKRIDKWCLYRLSLLISNVKNSYENFEFYKVYKYIYDFCNIDLSMHYLDMIKGRLYTYPSDSLERRSAQTVIYEVLNSLVRILSPILVFTAEEAYQNMPKKKEFISIRSVHLLEWPQLDPIWAKSDIEEELKIIFDLIPVSAKALEEMRSQGIIGSSFDAKIILLTNEDSYLSYLERLREDLSEIFKVSEVEILKKEIDESYSYRIKNLALLVKKADGLKCMRCWNYSLEVSKDKLQLCPRCFKIVKEYEEKTY